MGEAVMRAEHTLAVGLTPLESWALYLTVITGALLLVRWLLQVDDRDYDAETREPPSNVTVLPDLPCGHDECAQAAARAER